VLGEYPSQDDGNIQVIRQDFVVLVARRDDISHYCARVPKLVIWELNF
jgi:hypothetical protein